MCDELRDMVDRGVVPEEMMGDVRRAASAYKQAEGMMANYTDAQWKAYGNSTGVSIIKDLLGDSERARAMFFEMVRRRAAEGVGKPVRGKVPADTARKDNGLPAWLNRFLDVIREWVCEARALMEVGRGVNRYLFADEGTRGKFDERFRRMMEELTAQDVEYLRGLQREESEAARGRILRAARSGRAEAREEHPVMDAAEAAQGAQARADAAAEEAYKAEIDEDVSAAMGSTMDEVRSTKYAEPGSVGMGGAGGEGGSMSAVGRNAEEVAAKEKYEGTAAASAVSKVVEGVKEKVRGATTRAEYEARVPAAERGAISQEEELMMPVGQGVIEAVRNATGRDVTGYYHSVSEEMIWHAMQRHSHDEERSDYVGQLNLTWDDFALLPDILDSGVAKVTRWSQETTIEYTKDYGDVRYRVLQRVGRRRRSSPSRMMIVTEWVQKMTRRSGLAPDNARGNAPSTSGTGSVAQAGEDVNTKNAEGVKKDAEGGSFNVEEAREEGMMKDGVMVARNAVVAEPGVDFSAAVELAQHASPHLFREFDTEHIGSGEGHQAYGWGLYFSTNWGVNKNYWEKFSGGVVELAVGGEVRRLYKNKDFWDERMWEQFREENGLTKWASRKVQYILRDVLDGRGTIESRIKYEAEQAERQIRKYEEELRHEQQEWIRKLAEDGLEGERSVLEAVEFLEGHKEKVKAVGENAVDYLVDLEVEEGELLPWDGVIKDKKTREAVKDVLGERYDRHDVGEDVYTEMTRALGGQKEASEWLLARGVKGIKYEDNPSRERGKKTYNYVIFDGRDVKVRKVNNRGEWTDDVGAGQWEDAGDVVWEQDGASMAVEEAREEGLFDEGVMVVGNGVVAEPGVDFSMAVRGAQHASPHLFKEFDTSHMGRGEGQQAYGWGLYFSTNWGVNKWYWDKFGKRGGNHYEVYFKGKVIAGGNFNSKDVRDVVGKTLADKFFAEKGNEIYEGDRDGVEYMLYNLLVYALVYPRKRTLAKQKEQAENDIKSLEEEGIDTKILKRAVKLLEFLIANKAQIKSIINSVNYVVDLEIEEQELLQWEDRIRDEELRKAVAEVLGRKYKRDDVGEDVYRELTRKLGGQKEASEWLLARGIKGIKYADGFSRNNREDGTYNYVVFDGRDVKIRQINNREGWSEWRGRKKKGWQAPEDISMAVEDAREEGLFDEGVMVGGNGVVAEPGTDMSMAIKGLLHASPELFREFDTGHVGEGVGGHPYGWGIYMSKSWDENWMYWKRFAYDHGHAVNYMVDVEAEEGDMLGDEVKVGGLIRRKPELRLGLRELLSDKRMGDVRGWWGWMLYKELSERLGGDKEASEWLDRHGVRGVRYKSGDTARGVNYVIFNARNIRVTHVNESEEWSEYKEGNKEWKEVRSTKDEVRSGQSRGSEGASMSVVGGYRVENDTVGLQEHLNEAVVPVEINYTGDFAREMEEYAKENGMEGMNEKAYVRAIVGEAVQSLAEKYPEGMAIGDGEYRLMFPVGRRKATGVAGRRPSRVKGQIVGKLEDLIKKGIHIRTEVPDLSDAGKNKQKRFKWVRSVEVFGCPLRLNGEEMFFWFNGTTKNAEPQKVTLYEYGATETEKENAAAALAPIVGPHSRSAVSEGSIGEFLSRVKNKNVVDVKKVDGGGASMRVEVGGVEERLGTVLEGQLGGVGRSFKANEALVEQMLGEIKKGVGRVRRLAGRAESGREEALAVMGGLAQMVRAVRLYLPSGFGFAVEPYIRQVEVMSELAATGRVAFNAPISKALAREVKGLGEEAVKELGEARLADVLERVMGRVAEQLRRYAKREVVGRMEKLPAGLELKRKNGKLKGGKMGAEGYRAMDKVREAMGMDSEAVAGKLEAIQAELGRGDEASEMRRDELEGEMAIYSTFGDVEGMSLEGAAAAYEMLRFWVAAERFAWDDKRADMDVARGDVVRGVMKELGRAGVNAYHNAKVKVAPVGELKSLGDLFMSAVQTMRSMRKVPGVGQLPEEIALRVNRAGELMKTWERERWVRPEALSLVHAAAMENFRAAAFLPAVRSDEGDRSVGGVGGFVQGEGAGVFCSRCCHEL